MLFPLFTRAHQLPKCKHAGVLDEIKISLTWALTGVLYLLLNFIKDRDKTILSGVGITAPADDNWMRMRQEERLWVFKESLSGDQCALTLSRPFPRGTSGHFIQMDNRTAKCPVVSAAVWGDTKSTLVMCVWIQVLLLGQKTHSEPTIAFHKETLRRKRSGPLQLLCDWPWV